MSQHTPTATPWHTESAVEGEQPRWIVGAKGEQIAQCYSDYVSPVADDAAFIVRACNSHGALVIVSRLVADTYEAEQTRGAFPAGQTWGTIDHTTGQAARAALKLAKEN